MPVKSNFAQRLVAWQRQHGRNDLPWSGGDIRGDTGGDDYAVWLSEIMLQQTQVATVRPYFAAFRQAYPTLHDLAAAPIEDILARWAGLGYYARARNLHRCAQRVCAQYGGVFPRELAQLEALPGIGPSTAAAIASMAQQQCAAILDGNVKRVLARHAGIAGWAGEAAVSKQLWAQARARLDYKAIAPDHHRRYSQGLMDLGATLCTAKSPQCHTCPVAVDCVAFNAGTQAQIPSPRPKKTVPTQTRHALVLHNTHGVYLLRRPPTGLWGGLLSFIEADTQAELLEKASGLGVGDSEGLTDKVKPWHIHTLKHTFTHYHLDWRLWGLNLETDLPVPLHVPLPAPWQLVPFAQLRTAGVPRAVLKVMGQ